MSDVTSAEPQRLIYFKGHRSETNSALVTRVCRDYETVTGLLHGECATRTLWNLYNLHAVRGVVGDGRAADPAGPPPAHLRLDLRTSMSGPHSYMGWVDPTAAHVIEPRKPATISGGAAGPSLVYRACPKAPGVAEAAKPPVPAEYLLPLPAAQWLPGKGLTPPQRAFFFPTASSDPALLYSDLVDTQSGAADSLFDDPGVLALPDGFVRMTVLDNPQAYDLTPFRCQVVPNGSPFQFRQDLVSQHTHAQHRLRVVTYHYGDRYVPDYLMHGSGLFVERHDFIQAITPAFDSCGGFVLTGREVPTEEGSGAKKTLELLAMRVPYGYTWLVDVGCIHGDSTLTGTYMMAMTGNHTAMQSADTVFIKHAATGRNVRFSPSEGAWEGDGYQRTAAAPPAGTMDQQEAALLLTSSRLSLAQLHAADERVKAGIAAGQSTAKRLLWQPVITTMGGSGWKTLGGSLPEADKDGAATVKK